MNKRHLFKCLMLSGLICSSAACVYADAGITAKERAAMNANAARETNAGASVAATNAPEARQGAFRASDEAQISDENARREIEAMQKDFTWWPTDAKPAPVRDERGGYWWWPEKPGTAFPWGNRGYIYLYKLIFDYKEEELPPPKPRELRPSLLIKKIIKNVKIYFDYNKADVRDDAAVILKDAAESLKRNPTMSILITGNCDIRGSENYNDELGRQRAESVKKFMQENGITEDKIRIISRGKLDAVAHITDLVGMQKDRNAQFMVAEVQEVMIPYMGKGETAEAKKIEEGKFLLEQEKKVESEVKVKTKEYTIQKGDTLWKIAEKEMGSGYRWKYLYEINKERIKNKDKLNVGGKIIIPIE